MTARKYLMAGWWLGAIMFMSIMGFMQDWLGLERYLEVVSSNWVHMSPWWWLIPGLISFFLSFFYYHKAIHKGTQ